MEDLLKRIKELELEVLKQSKDKKLNKFIFYDNESKEEYRSTLDYKKEYFLITLTFSDIVKHFDIDTQAIHLTRCVDHFYNKNYYSCFEKHKSGVLHMHILITDVTCHEIHKEAHKFKKELTNSIYLAPAIKIDPVIQRQTDIDKAYNYIWDHKKDHPLYKKIKINV